MPPLHRSRIRRRSNGRTDCHRNGSSAAISATVTQPSSVIVPRALVCLLLALPLSTTAYIGPTHCTKPGTSAASIIQSNVMGYSTFNHLLFDMVSLATAFKAGRSAFVTDARLKFSICVGTVIDLDDTSLPLGFLPIEVPRLTLQCGDDHYVRPPTTSKSDRGDTSNKCTIRGGGKRLSNSTTWNTHPGQAYKASKSGIVGGGSVAQIYVYGESAYDITLKGITFDNSVTREEMQLYQQYVASFPAEGGAGSEDGFGSRKPEKIEEEYDEAVPNTVSNSKSSSSVNNNWGGANQLNENRGTLRRNLQGQKQKEDTNSDNAVNPAHRFASVAVLGKGYGDDAGPRLITIDDCRFEYHRGYTVLVSPGIQQPNLPVAPRFDFPQPPKPSTESNAAEGNSNGSTGGDKGVEDIMSSVNLQSSGQIYNGNGNNNNNNDKTEAGNNPDRRQHKKQRNLNLLDNGEKFIPQGGRVSYYDHAFAQNYLDGRRVKITKTDFANNIISGENVAGLITSAYSLTLTDCFFQHNSAKAMVFVYSNDALVDNTIFAENTVEVSTVIMASPKGSKKLVTASGANMNLNGNDEDFEEPTHIVERTCFLASHVGMSNVLVTDIQNTGFGQRYNHAAGTEFTWVSTCEGGAAEQTGNNCLETGNCGGTCVQFTEEKCQAKRMNSPEFGMLFSAADRRSVLFNSGVWWASSLGTVVWLLV